MIAPSPIASKCSRRKTLRLPVAVMNSSPQAAASARVMTSKPSMSASMARTGSTSTTATWAPMPGHPRGDAAADPAIAGDDHLAAGEQDVGGPQDAVDGRLAGAVAVVEEVLGLGLVDGDDREAKRAVGGHRLEPDDAGGRLLGPGQDLRQLARPLAVEQRHEVAAVVHGQLRVGVRDRVRGGRSTCRGPRRGGRRSRMP